MSTVTWQGLAGRTYNFTLYNEGANPLPSVGGVYILCRSRNNKLVPLYIGESQSFQDRLITNRASHDGYARADAHGVTHICLMGSSNAQQRLAVETELRQVYKPVCNAQPTAKAS